MDGLGNDFLVMIPKAQATKGKIGGLHQTKKLLHSKGDNQQNAFCNLENRRKYLQTMYLIFKKLMPFRRQGMIVALLAWIQPVVEVVQHFLMIPESLGGLSLLCPPQRLLRGWVNINIQNT